MIASRRAARGHRRWSPSCSPRCTPSAPIAAASATSSLMINGTPRRAAQRTQRARPARRRSRGVGGLVAVLQAGRRTRSNGATRASRRSLSGSSGVIRYRPRLSDSCDLAAWPAGCVRSKRHYRFRPAPRWDNRLSQAHAGSDERNRRQRHRLPHLDVRGLRFHLRRGARAAGRRHRPGHALGRRARTPGPARIAA